MKLIITLNSGKLLISDKMKASKDEIEKWRAELSTLFYRSNSLVVMIKSKEVFIRPNSIETITLNEG